MDPHPEPEEHGVPFHHNGPGLTIEAIATHPEREVTVTAGVESVDQHKGHLGSRAAVLIQIGETNTGVAELTPAQAIALGEHLIRCGRTLTA